MNIQIVWLSVSIVLYQNPMNKFTPSVLYNFERNFKTTVGLVINSFAKVSVSPLIESILIFQKIFEKILLKFFFFLFIKSVQLF
jgi:putative AlgH/UPF0301 family transcriptional regulator